jgi:DNA mismatch endonuclease, patch repair protein
MPKGTERPNPVSLATSRRMSRTAQRDNSGERALRSELHRRGLRFRLHRSMLANSRRTVDIAFSFSKVAVFVDGCFWHGCPEHGTWPKNNRAFWRAKIEQNVARDRDTDRRLNAAGWTVVRIWTHEPVRGAANRIETTIRRALHQRAKTRPRSTKAFQIVR